MGRDKALPCLYPFFIFPCLYFWLFELPRSIMNYHELPRLLSRGLKGRLLVGFSQILLSSTSEYLSLSFDYKYDMISWPLLNLPIQQLVSSSHKDHDVVEQSGQ